MEKDTQLGKDHRKIGAARFARRNYKRGAAAFGRRPPFIGSYIGVLLSQMRSYKYFVYAYKYVLYEYKIFVYAYKYCCMHTK